MSEYISGTSYSDGKTQHAVAYRMKHGERPGFKMTELVLEKGQVIPWHTHTVVNDTFYVVEGQLRVEAKDPEESVVLNPTETHTIRYGRPHFVTSNNNERVHFVVIGDTQRAGTYDYIPFQK